MILIGNNISKTKIEIITINLIVLLFIFRSSCPVFKYPFVILYAVFTCYIIIFYRKIIIDKVKKYVRNYVLVAILLLILLLTFLYSDKIYLLVFKDILNVVVLISLFFILTFVVENKQNLSFFVSSLIFLVILFALLISVLGLLESFDIIASSIITAPKIDGNFALLPVLFGLISTFYFLNITGFHKIQRIYYNLLLHVFSLHIFFSGSRRGVIILGVIITIIILTQLLSLFKKDNFLKKLASNSRYYLLFLSLITMFFYFFIFHTDYRFKNKTLVLIGSKNISATKKNISTNLHKYASIINSNLNYSKFDDIIWTRKFDPKDPESGWGYTHYKREFPLIGNNVEIVPHNSVGCLIDSSSFNSNDHRVIYSLIKNLKVKEGEKYSASIYCYVSDDFNGFRVSFLLGWNAVNAEVVSHNPVSTYTMKNKGSWQKLNMEFDCNDGSVPIYISILLNTTKDSLKMNGYVILAHPEYMKVEPKDSSLILAINDKLNQTKKVISYYEPSFFERISPILSNFKVNTQAGIFYTPVLYLANVNLMIKDKDPIRNWVAKFVSEDTTYVGYESYLDVDTIPGEFSGSRIMRWHFAWQIFAKEYNWKEKIFGGGFNFLNWYGYYFKHDKTKSDYPHNPFLHILLYSGVLGLLLYVFFISKVFFYYIKYIKEVYILFVFFLVTFFFTFFSGRSPFDPPIMGFFVILPFFIHSIYKNEILDFN
jgi:O-antigen ligase